MDGLPLPPLLAVTSTTACTNPPTKRGRGEIQMVFRKIMLSVLSLSFLLCAIPSRAQLGNSGTIEGVVRDQSGGVVADATVEISYGVSGLHRQTTTGSDGTFRFTNVPFNPYHMVVTANGFATLEQDVEVRSVVPTSVAVNLKVGTSTTSITVLESTGEGLVEKDPVFHTDVDKDLFDKVPLESQSSSLSSLVTLTTPGVVADSNGLFHALGDHADNSFSYDGQPITDQQSKVFSNQIPAESIQSMEVVAGAPPAEFGDKTSLIIKVTTRSGLGVTTPHGSVTASYGSFGSVTGGFDVAFGGQKWGNFIAGSGLNTSRFLDPPELHAIHDKGNEENVFDRVDYLVTSADTIHVNLGYSRSWFQTPNTIDNLNAGATNPVTGNPLGPTDQRSQIKTYNIAPVWTRLISPTTLFTLGAFVRADQYNYYPTADVFADGTGTIPGGSSLTINQDRKLTNAGLRADVSYVKGINNIKAGVTFQHTFLTENFNFGITDPLFNSPCVDSTGAPVGLTSLTNPGQCAAAGFSSNAQSAGGTFLPLLGCIDLSRPTPSPNDACATTQSALFPFHGHTDVKEIALYIQDTITKGNWAFNLGFREDFYRGIVRDTQPEPRLGVAYNIKKTNTVLRLGYARIQATPYNENLILSSTGSTIPTVNAVFNGVNSQPFAPIRPGFRNQFDAGFQQAFGKFLVVDADYFWKYTRNGYDFSIFGGTPITFPIAWHNSKLNGASVRVSVPDFHGFTAFTVLGTASARYFPPQIGGLGATVGGGSVFRIDHDQKFQQTTHLQYQPRKTLPWIGFNWRYDSGLVASNPNLDTFNDTLGFLDADQQTAIGLFCGPNVATLTNPLTPAVCAGQTNEGARLIHIAGATFNPDHNPTRVAPRNLFDMAVGDDNLFRADRYRWSLRFTVVNLTNKTALYNFLSTFSGTHFVTPRSYTAELGFHF
jgi:hypothetical protein